MASDAFENAQRLIMDRALHGTSFITRDGTRVDPAQVHAIPVLSECDATNRFAAGTSNGSSDPGT